MFTTVTAVKVAVALHGGYLSGSKLSIMPLSDFLLDHLTPNLHSMIEKLMAHAEHKMLEEALAKQQQQQLRVQQQMYAPQGQWQAPPGAPPPLPPRPSASTAPATWF